jgi:hypothetical protein
MRDLLSAFGSDAVSQMTSVQQTTGGSEKQSGIVGILKGKNRSHFQ